MKDESPRSVESNAIKQFFSPNRFRLTVISLLLSAALLLIFGFHGFLNTGRVFTHLFYIPIILASIWWPRKDLVVPLLLGCALIASHRIFRTEQSAVNDYCRAAMFVTVALAVSRLRRRCLRSECGFQALEGRYASLVNGSPDLIVYQLDPRGLIVSIGGAVEQLTGYPPGELAGLPVTVLVPVELAPRVRWQLHERRTGPRATRRFELTVRKKPLDDRPGSTLTVELNACGLYDHHPTESGRTFRGTFGVIRDITKGRQTERALADSQAEFRVVVENAPVGLVISTPCGPFEYLNPAFTRITGYSLADLSNERQWFELAYPDRGYRQHALDLWHAYLKTGATDLYDYRVRCRNGEEKTLRFSAVTMQDGRHLVTVMDISGQVKAKADLKRSRAILRAVFDGISEPMFILDRQLTVLLINRSALEGCRSSAYQDVVGKPCHLAFKGRSFPCEGCRIAFLLPSIDVKKSRTPPTFDQTGLFHPQRLERVTVYPFQNDLPPDGCDCAIVRIADITEQNRAEQQLARADRLASLGQLSAGVAHEIRNPLSAIRLYADILRDPDRFQPSAQQIEIANEIMGNTERIAEIVKRVLCFAAPSFDVSVPVEINTLVSETMDLWRHRIGQSEIVLKLSLCEGKPVIAGDPIQLQQVLNNLVLNAVEAMPSGGTLDLATTAGPSSTDEDRQSIFLQIADTGAGIPAEHEKEVFDPFFTTKPNGTGLGLSISHRIVERHGGLISFRSKSARGTTFTIELPIASMGLDPRSRPSKM